MGGEVLEVTQFVQSIQKSAKQFGCSCAYCIVLCIYTQRNISIHYRTQSAIKPIRLHRYSPNSQVTDIPLTGR